MSPDATAEALQSEVLEVLKTCYDPEIPVNIYDLGLIYKVDVEGSDVKVDMTLTSPMCPVAGSLPPEVEMKIGMIPGVKSASVSVVWDPPWTKDMMSADAKAVLNIS